jgi:hypothetical protein
LSVFKWDISSAHVIIDMTNSRYANSLLSG